MNSNYRPDREWYMRLIQESQNDEILIGPAFANPQAERVKAQPPITVAFGVLVSFSRRAKKLSAEELAKKISVDPSEIIGIERNPDFRARPRTISQLSKFFDLPLQELMKLAGAAVANDDRFKSQALKFAAHSDDVAALSAEEQSLLKSFVSYLRSQH